MEALDLPRNYQTIIDPSSSFQLVTDMDLARQALKRFYDHLEPEGILVMAFMIMWQPGDAKELDWTMIMEVPHPEDGTVVRRWLKNWINAEKQLEHTEDRYEIMRDGEVITSEHHQWSPATRWYSQDQATQLYQDAGFTNIHAFNGFTKEQVTEADTVFTVLGQKQ